MSQLAVAQSRFRAGGGRTFVLLGALMALIAFGLVFLLGGGVGGARGVSGPQVSVLVAAHDIPLRATIVPSDLAIKQYAQADVPPGVFTKKDDVKNLVAEVNISQGQAVTQNLVAKSLDQVTGAQAAFLPIPPGFVAFTMPAGEQQAVAGYIQAGDYITIQATAVTGIFPNSGASRSVVRTVFNNVHVIRIGPNAGGVAPSGTQGQAAPSTGVSSSLTIVMTACDAEYMNWLLANTQLRYELESFKDYGSPPSKPDDTCPTIGSGRGVGPADVDHRFGFSTK